MYLIIMSLVFSNVYVFLFLSLNITYKDCNTKCIIHYNVFLLHKKITKSYFLLNI